MSVKLILFIFIELLLCSRTPGSIAWATELHSHSRRSASQSVDSIQWKSTSLPEFHLDSFNISLLVGPAFMIGPATTPHTPHGEATTYKVTGSYLFHNHFELGLELGVTDPYPTIGVDLNYFINPHLYVGVDGTLKFSHLSLYEYMGPKAGYDFRLSHRLTAGPELLYLYPLHGHIHILETLLAVKFFF